MMVKGGENKMGINIFLYIVYGGGFVMFFVVVGEEKKEELIVYVY